MPEKTEAVKLGPPAPDVSLLGDARVARVACVACGRLIVASPNGHPRRHAPRNRLSGPQQTRGTCDGTFLPGDRP